MKKLILIFMIVLITGCNNKKYNQNVEMICDNIITNFQVTEGNTISCNTYNFKVKKVKKDKIIIKSNIKVDSKDEFSFSKDNDLELKISENVSIILRWKE